MLLCFVAYVIATLTSYTVQFMNCLHCLLDKTMWNQQFGWLTTTPKFEGILAIGWEKRWTITRQLIQLWPKGWVSIDPCSNIQIPVDAFNVLEACDKSDENGSVVSIQEWNISKTSMPRFMFAIFATTKNRASIHAWCWHETKKSESRPQSWYTEGRRLIRWCLYLEANEEQSTVNDLIVNITNSLWLVMMIMTHKG